MIAMPDGIAIAVMITIAYSLRQKMDQSIIVKRIASNEIIARVDNICTDKTGVLTMNKMEVIRIFAGQKDMEIP